MGAKFKFLKVLFVEFIVKEVISKLVPSSMVRPFTHHYVYYWFGMWFSEEKTRNSVTLFKNKFLTQLIFFSLFSSLSDLLLKLR